MHFPNILANLLHTFLEQRHYTGSQEMVKHLQTFFLAFSEGFSTFYIVSVPEQRVNLSKFKRKVKIPDTFLIVYRAGYLLLLQRSRKLFYLLASRLQETCRMSCRWESMLWETVASVLRTKMKARFSMEKQN